MKKLFSILIALALLAGVSTMAFAGEAGTIAYGGGVGIGSLRTVTCINNTATGTITRLPIAESINSTWGTVEPGIIPGKVKILGYDMSFIGPGPINGGTCSLLDAPEWSMNSGDIFAEMEATLTSPVAKIFPIGLDLHYRLFVDQTAYTSVTIYYVQTQG
jgi:hypothetical protein